MNHIKSLFVLLFLFYFVNIYCQKGFSFCAKSGILIPFTTFNEGIESDANKDHQFNKKVGFVTTISSSININSRNKIIANFLFESFDFSIQENVKFPEDAFLPKSSFYYSNFENKNFGVGIKYAKKLNNLFWFEGGIQFSIPINPNNGYLYSASLDKIVEDFSYNSKNKFALVSNLEIPVVSKKKFELNLNPGFTYFLTKTPKTIALQNQLNPYYFSILLGITIK